MKIKELIDNKVILIAILFLILLVSSFLFLIQPNFFSDIYRDHQSSRIGIVKVKWCEVSQDIGFAHEAKCYFGIRLSCNKPLLSVYIKPQYGPLTTGNDECRSVLGELGS